MIRQRRMTTLKKQKGLSLIGILLIIGVLLLTTGGVVVV